MAKKRQDPSGMTVREAGRKGGDKVRRWIEEGKRQEQEGRRGRKR